MRNQSNQLNKAYYTRQMRKTLKERESKGSQTTQSPSRQWKGRIKFKCSQRLNHFANIPR